MGLRTALVVAAVLLHAGCGRDREPRPNVPVTAGVAGADAEAPNAAGAPVDPGETRDGLWFPGTASIGEHVRVLAAPALHGRAGGSTDEVAAADKMAGWFRAAGLEPGSDGGWIQGFDVEGGPHSQNVIGVVRGSDPRAGHVIVGAHYDHLGRADGGGYYPGADDNASGSAALIAIATALTRDGQRPRRTVVFVAFGAEETGLHGSTYYAAHPIRPLGEAALMINLDMVGRAEFLAGAEYRLAHALVPANGIGALTSEGDRDIALLAKAAGEREARPIVAASDFGPLESMIRPAVEYRGDHKSFGEAGVRYLWLSTSMHDDYHLPSDTADKVDPATIATVGRIVVRVIQTLP